jgi:hypothetical protein
MGIKKLSGKLVKLFRGDDENAEAAAAAEKKKAKINKYFIMYFLEENIINY